MTQEIIYSGLIWIALLMLVLVTGGVAYLTLVDWNERRQREREERSKTRK
jgi:heme/copper-type cytochrome/quinol oxidase subunit 2